MSFNSTVILLVLFSATAFGINESHVQKSPTVSSDSEALEGREKDDRPENIPQGAFDFAQGLSVDLSAYNYIDAARTVPDRPLQMATQFFEMNKGRIRNQRYVTIVDFRVHSGQARMWVVDMQSGTTRSFYVAHGSGSDPDADGYATKFSNSDGTHMSSIGFYLTGGLYSGKHGTSMFLHGLESTNSNAYARSVVMHGADYVNPGSVGRSWGCPAIEMKYIDSLLPQLQDGSLLLIYYNQ